MRIAHLANMYGPRSGGLRTTVDRLTWEYAERGHQVLMLIPDQIDSRDECSGLLKVRLKSPYLPLSGGYRIIVSLGKVVRILREFEPDVIEISDRSSLLLIAPWARRRGIQVTLFAHERLSDALMSFFPKVLGSHEILSRMITAWNSWCERNVDKIIATTEFASREFPYSLKTKVIALGVDHNIFHPGQGDEMAMDFPGEGFLLACTRLSPEKDPRLLLEIARELTRRDSKMMLIIIGAGPMTGTLREEAIRDELAISFIGFLGQKEVLAQYMRKASVFLAPGPIETFGLAALEAMACGTPVICRDSAAIVEIIDNSSGLALSRDAKLWADAIEEFLSHDRNDLAKACHERASGFTWSATASALLQSHHDSPRARDQGIVRSRS